MDCFVALLLAMTGLRILAQSTKLPDGQLTSDLRKSCQAKNQYESKIIRFIRKEKCGIRSSSRPDQRGARDRHERGTGCDGRGSAVANGAMPGEASWRRRVLRTAKTCGPDAPKLASAVAT